MIEDEQSLEERLNKLKESDSALADTPAMGEDVALDEKQMQKALETTQKPVLASERESGEKADRPKGPVGLDVGTSNIVAAQNKTLL